MKLFYLLPTILLLASCSRDPAITTPILEIKRGTPSDLQMDIGKADQFTGDLKSHTVRQTLLKKTNKGLKIVSEYNYASPALDGKEYTRLYCVIDINADNSLPAETKKQIRNSFKRSEIPLSLIFISEDEYNLLPSWKLKNALVWKYREQIVSGRFALLSRFSFTVLLDSASETPLGAGIMNYLFFPTNFIYFMLDDETPDKNRPGHITYINDKTESEYIRKCHAGILNLPYTDRLFFFGAMYTIMKQGRHITTILPPRNNSERPR